MFICSDEYITAYVRNAPGHLVHGDSLYCAPKQEFVNILDWILADIPGEQSSRVQHGDISMQGLGGGNGSCAVTALNFIQQHNDLSIPKWTGHSSDQFWMEHL
ncbi:hypothetical protein C8J56DRAFT_776491 [Mycena floridula]|nr:hypothetical protein C8J56DRAFT_776491 [Mycena floridula]